MNENLIRFADHARKKGKDHATIRLAVKRSNGQRIGTVPYGYDLAADRSTLVPNDAEQAVIADIRAMRGRGVKLKQIADELTEKSIPTKTGRSDRWTHQAVARIVERA